MTRLAYASLVRSCVGGKSEGRELQHDRARGRAWADLHYVGYVNGFRVRQSHETGADRAQLP